MKTLIALTALVKFPLTYVLKVQFFIYCVVTADISTFALSKMFLDNPLLNMQFCPKTDYNLAAFATDILVFFVKL